MPSSLQRTLLKISLLRLPPRTLSFASLPRSKNYRMMSSTGTSRAAKTPAGEVISQVAQQEGGPISKDSLAAQMQSEATRVQNAAEVDAVVKDKMDRGLPVDKDEAALAQSREARAPLDAPVPGTVASEAQSQADKEENAAEAARAIGEKMINNPSAVTSEDAAYLESRIHRATGVNPPSDSLAADAKRLAAANENNEPILSGDALESVDKSDLTRAEQSALDKEANFRQVAADVAGKIATEPENVMEQDAALLHSREERAHGKAAKGGIASEAQKLVAEKKKEGRPV